MDRAQHVRYKSAERGTADTQRPSALVMADRDGNKDKGKCDGRFGFLSVVDCFLVVYNNLGLRSV